VFDVKEASGDAGGDLTLTVLDWDLASAPDQVGSVTVFNPETLNLNPNPQPQHENLSPEFALPNLKPQPETLNAEPSTLNSKPRNLNTEP